MRLSVATTWAQEAKTVGFRDDCTRDPGADYRTPGEIRWEKGRVTLPPR
jgi:hypothetical protein